MKRKNRFRPFVATLLAATAGIAMAQPAKTVMLLVGFPAGGAPDAVARAFAEPLRQVIGQTVVIENKSGASGKLAIDALGSAAPDGQTIAIIPASLLALTPQVLKSARYDAVQDFVGVGSLAEYGFGVAAGPAAGVPDLAGYKAWAARNAKLSTFATPGLGTPQHFLGAQLQKALGVELTHVPYKGGAAAVNDVIGGQVALLISTEQLLVPYEAQKLQTLFITSSQRNARMPKVPTAREVGLPQLESTDWFGLFLKAGTPSAKVEEWRAAVTKAVSNPAYAEAVRNLGYTVPARQPADFSQAIKTMVTAWGNRVKLANFNAMD